MEKSMWNGIVIFIGGTLMGFVVSRIIMVKKCLVLEERYSDLEMLHMKLLETTVQEIDPEATVTKEKRPSSINPISISNVLDLNKNGKNIFPVTKSVEHLTSVLSDLNKYGKLAKRYTAKESYPFIIDDPVATQHPLDDEGETIELPSDQMGNPPYIITSQEFSEEMDSFDKITITYYEKDSTLVDEGEQIIPDIIGTIGHALEDSDDDVVYVRNEGFNIDYEVIRFDASFSENTQ